MVRIQLSNGSLDMNVDETVQMSWVTTRFSTSIRDPFTNDFTIPKTQNNIRLLSASGLIDSATQKLGGAFVPATLTVDDGQPKSIKIQVVSVSPTDIKICCYENVIPADFMNSDVTDWFSDIENETIWPWDRNSRTRYPNIFREYNYGMLYNTSYAQLHPVMKILDVVNDLSAVSGYHLPTTQNHFPIDYWLLATNKTVCPQNRKQIIEGVKAPIQGETEDERRTFKIIAGQHITNDAVGYQEESTTTEIIFNRYAYIYATMNISWQVPQSYGTYQIAMLKNGQTEKIFYINVPNSDTTSGVVTSNVYFSVNEGDVISFKITGLDVFEKINFMMDCTISGYEITEDDYGTDLVYCPRPARLVLYQYYNTQGVHEINCYADGNTYSYCDDKFGYHSSSFSMQYRSLSYFGYWCNVPKFKVKDMVFSIGWFSGSKVVNVNDKYEYKNAEDRKEITGLITELYPADEHFGQTSMIGYKDDQNPWTYHYDNIWLEKEKWLHKSVFGAVLSRKKFPDAGAMPLGMIKQYSLERNGDDVTCNFEYINTPILMRLVAWSGQTYLAPPRKISQMGFNNITCIMRAEIETTNMALNDVDYIYLDGREYMVVSGENDFKEQKAKIVAMLVNHMPIQGTRSARTIR